MAFNVVGGAYQRFMGEFSDLLSASFADLADVTKGSGQRAADVGCGPGALSAELVARLGPGSVAAADPSPSFVASVRERLPGVDVRRAVAEDLPWADDLFDAALAQLVVHFMSDPVAGIVEMARVTRPGGVVGACVWDHGGARGPLAHFWRAARELDPSVDDESARAGVHSGDLVGILEAAGLLEVEEHELLARRPYAGFDDWWEPYLLGVGPAGDHVAHLDDAGRDLLRERCRTLFPEGAFTVDALAWAARGVVA